MARSKSKPLPVSESIDDLVEFFDTHDMGDYWDQLPEAAFEIKLEKRHLVAIDEEIANVCSASSAQDSICRMSSTGSFQVQAADIELLRNRWHTLTAKYSDDESARDASFRSIVQEYSGANRAYHNLSHVKALMALYDEFKSGDGCDAVWFAIWYHDLIYDTRRQDNEQKSAALACKALGDLGVGVDTIAEVERMIIATKHHRAKDLSADGQLFLDLDMSILGAPAALYREYSRAIRQEYDWVPLPVYRAGRCKILNDFLRRRHIFFTEQLSAKFEDQARRNLEDELKELAG